MKRTVDQFFALDTPRNCVTQTGSRTWLRATPVTTAAIDPRYWQTRAARGLSWDSHGQTRARPGQFLTTSF